MRLVDTPYIERYGLPWCYRQDAARCASSGKAFIINLDDRGGAGTHWTAARLVDDTLYYADPFGTIMNGWPPSELDGVGTSRIVNRVSFQRPKSDLCGYYAICFALAMDWIDRPLTRPQFEQLLYNAIV